MPESNPDAARTAPAKQRVIITGATSGIGRALATAMHDAGYVVCVTGRRVSLLESLRDELHQDILIREMDVSAIKAARSILLNIITELGGVDIIVLNAGIGWSWPTFEQDIETVQVNCTGFLGLAHIAIDYFIERGHGHLVGVSSVMGQRGVYVATTYGATKAFISSYLQGIQHRMKRQHLNVAVTDIRPGFVRTPMTEENKNMLWLIDTDRAAQLILRAIKARREVAYIPERWRLVGWLLRLAPRWLAERV